MKRLSFIILVLAILITASSCDERKLVKSPFYSLEVETWAFLGAESFEAFIYNRDLSAYPPKRRGGISFKENTLYVIRNKNLGEGIKTDTLEISLTEEQVDSLYDLAYHYLDKFEIDNKVELNKAYEVIQDGVNISVSLNYEGKKMECSQYRLKGISNASKGGEKLIEFIDSKVAEERVSNSK